MLDLIYSAILACLAGQDVANAFPPLDMYLSMIPGHIKTCIGNVTLGQLDTSINSTKRMDGKVLAIDGRKKVYEQMENKENRVQICTMDGSSCTKKFTLSGWFQYLIEDSSACKGNLKEEITVSGNMAYIKTVCKEGWNTGSLCLYHFTKKQSL
uniref:Secreted protein n=1 Tax=Ditylenchus dipsaci TaxID=166011 RepID=A0A915DVT6_9BILA